jgi:GAF domain-containing protein
LSQGSSWRSWQVIAQELVAETNAKRVLELSQELSRALEKRELAKRWEGHPADTKPQPNGQTNPYQTNQYQKNQYQKIVDNAVALMCSDYASIQMLVPERGPGGELRLLAFRGFNPEAAKFWEWVRADSKSTCGIALLDKKRVVATDIAGCDFMAGSEDQQIYLQTGIRACQTTPLVGVGGKIVGMISTHWRRPHEPSEEHFRSFDILARYATEVIERCGPDGHLP